MLLGGTAVEVEASLPEANPKGIFSMSFLDRIAAAVTPAASDEDRAEARRKVSELATRHEWLAQIVAHHREIERNFEQALTAGTPAERTSAMKSLATILNGHSLAEEVVIYPNVAEHDSKTHAAMAYEEQSMAKVQMAKLETIDPMSEEWREKLEHIQGAVQQHVYQEEDSWFPDLAKDLGASESKHLSERYREEAARYLGSNARS